MSIKLMSLVWELHMPASEKLVLLALADQANDNGKQCWPALQSIARRSGYDERTVRRILRVLETKGQLTTQRRDGTSSQYHIHPGHCAPPDTVPPRTLSAKTPDTTPPHPGHCAPQTINEPLEPPIGAKAPKRARDNFPDWLPLEAWQGFLEMRKAKGAKPTPRATGLLIAKLDRLRSNGHDPGAVLDQSTENNWTGIFEVKANGSQNIRNGGGNGPDKRSGLAKALDGIIAGELC